ECGERRRFGGVEVTWRLVEVSLRRSGNAVIPATEIDGIQICLEDVLLAESPFELDRDDRFTELTPIRPFTIGVQRPGQLLRDRARPLDDAMCPRVRVRRANDGDGVESGVVVEAAVFTR